MSAPIRAWNPDKPHRCPDCHAVTDEKRHCKWAVVTCCKCAARFTRWPRISWLLPKVGIQCKECPR